MTEKEVKEWLNRAYDIDRLIQLDIEKIKELEESSKTLGGLSISERVQTSTNTKSPFEEKVFNKDEAIKKYEERILERMRLKEEIDEVIHSLHENEIIAVLDYRYLKFLSFKKIAGIMYMSQSTIYRLHEKGLYQVSKKLRVNES